MAKKLNWKPPKLYKGKRWWIEYQFCIPGKLRHRYKGAKWKGFPVFEDINRYKTDEYTQLLLNTVKFALEQGFNPFEYEKKEFVAFKQDNQTTPDKVWSCIQAFNLFTQEWENQGLEDGSNRTFNNNLSAVATVFIFLESEKIIKRRSARFCGESRVKVFYAMVSPWAALS